MITPNIWETYGKLKKFQTTIQKIENQPRHFRYTCCCVILLEISKDHGKRPQTVVQKDMILQISFVHWEFDISY